VGLLQTLNCGQVSLRRGFHLVDEASFVQDTEPMFSKGGEKNSPSSGILGLRISFWVDDNFLPQLTLPRKNQSIPIIPLTILAFHLHLPSYLFIKK